jgi:hypothetical protein
MKNLLALLTISSLFSCSTNNDFVPQKTKLADKWDTIFYFGFPLKKQVLNKRIMNLIPVQDF